MAVGRLSGAWILELLRANHPDGVLRRVLLDQFAALLVTPRSSPGAKGRLARRLYARLAMLQRRGQIGQEEGVVRPLTGSRKGAHSVMPPLGPLLRKKHFLALMAEDGNQDGGNAANLRLRRWEFLGAAVEAGWSVAEAAAALGLPAAKAAELIAHPGRT